jgi:hypothetical protein
MKQVNALDQQAKSMANTEPAKKFVLIGEEKTELANFGALFANKRETDNQISVAGLKLHDIFISHGYKKEHFCALDDTQKEVSGELLNLRDQVLDSMVDGIVKVSPRFKGLYRKDKATLSLDQQADQAVLKSIVKAAYNNFKSALDRKEVSAKKGGARSGKTDDIGMILKDVQSDINRIQKLKTAYHGSVEHVKMLRVIESDLKKLAVIKPVK